MHIQPFWMNHANFALQKKDAQVMGVITPLCTSIPLYNPTQKYWSWMDVMSNNITRYYFVSTLALLLQTSVAFKKISTWTNVRIYSYHKFDTNKCPTKKYLCWNLYEYLNIFCFLNSFHTLAHSGTNVRVYLYKKIDTNKCPNTFA